MGSLKQNIKTVLAEVEVFLRDTLQGDRLSGAARDGKDRLLDKVARLLRELSGEEGISGGSINTSGGCASGDGSDSNTFLHSTHDVAKKSPADLENVHQSGLLEKRKTKGIRSWESVYCVVSSSMFYIYKKQSDKEQKEAFCLNGYQVREPAEERDAGRRESSFELTNQYKTYQFRAGSRDAAAIWREAVKKGLEEGEEGEEKGGHPGRATVDSTEQFDEPDDIYEECGDDAPFKAPVQPASDGQDIYDDCQTEPGAAGKGREAPLPPGNTAPAAANKSQPPVPRADIPPVPERRTPPSLPDSPPPLPGRAMAMPDLRRPFLDRDEDFEYLFYGRWDCQAQSHKELSFRQGEIIHVLSQQPQEPWWVGEVWGRIGLVPADYLTPAFQQVA